MTDRKVLMRYSDDGGHTWSNWREKSLGEVGEYQKRLQFTQLGGFVTRIFHVRVSSPVKRDLLGAVAMLEGTDG